MRIYSLNYGKRFILFKRIFSIRKKGKIFRNLFSRINFLIEIYTKYLN